MLLNERMTILSRVRPLDLWPGSAIVVALGPQLETPRIYLVDEQVFGRAFFGRCSFFSFFHSRFLIQKKKHENVLVDCRPSAGIVPSGRRAVPKLSRYRS